MQISGEIQQISCGFHMKSIRFHADFVKSSRFHMKSTGFHADFVKSGRFHADFVKSAGFHVKSADFVRISKDQLPGMVNPMFIMFCIICKLCFQNICTTLWCQVENKCLTRLEAAAEGTLCGENEVF